MFDKLSAEQLIYLLNSIYENHPLAVFRHALRKVRKLYDIPDPYKPDGSPIVLISTIVRVVATHYGMEASDITSHKRNIIYLTPRHITYFISFILSGQSKVVIGKRLGGRDHSTIVYGVKKIQKAIKESEIIETLIDGLIEKCIDASAEERAINIRKMKCQNQRTELTS
jgi:hypothetical protein